MIKNNVTGGPLHHTPGGDISTVIKRSNTAGTSRAEPKHLLLKVQYFLRAKKMGDWGVPDVGPVSAEQTPEFIQVQNGDTLGSAAFCASLRLVRHGRHDGCL